MKDQLHLVTKSPNFLLVILVYAGLTTFSFVWFIWIHIASQDITKHHDNMAYTTMIFVGILGIAELCKNDPYLQNKKAFQAVYDQIVDSCFIMLLAIVTEHVLGFAIWKGSFGIADSIAFMKSILGPNIRTVTALWIHFTAIFPIILASYLFIKKYFFDNLLSSWWSLIGIF